MYKLKPNRDTFFFRILIVYCLFQSLHTSHVVYWCPQLRNKFLYRTEPKKDVPICPFPVVNCKKMHLYSAILYLFLFFFSYKFNDMILPDQDTYKVTIRMFLEFGLVQKFNIPYQVKIWILLIKYMSHFWGMKIFEGVGGKSNAAPCTAPSI